MSGHSWKSALILGEILDLLKNKYRILEWFKLDGINDFLLLEGVIGGAAAAKSISCWWVTLVVNKQQQKNGLQIIRYLQ